MSIVVQKIFVLFLYSVYSYPLSILVMRRTENINCEVNIYGRFR